MYSRLLIRSNGAAVCSKNFKMWHSNKFSHFLVRFQTQISFISLSKMMSLRGSASQVTSGFLNDPNLVKTDSEDDSGSDHYGVPPKATSKPLSAKNKESVHELKLEMKKKNQEAQDKLQELKRQQDELLRQIQATESELHHLDEVEDDQESSEQKSESVAELTHKQTKEEKKIAAEKTKEKKKAMKVLRDKAKAEAMRISHKNVGDRKAAQDAEKAKILEDKAKYHAALHEKNSQLPVVVRKDVPILPEEVEAALHAEYLKYKQQFYAEQRVNDPAGALSESFLEWNLNHQQNSKSTHQAASQLAPSQPYSPPRSVLVPVPMSHYSPPLAPQVNVFDPGHSAPLPPTHPSVSLMCPLPLAGGQFTPAAYSAGYDYRAVAELQMGLQRASPPTMRANVMPPPPQQHTVLNRGAPPQLSSRAGGPHPPQQTWSGQPLLKTAAPVFPPPQPQHKANYPPAFGAPRPAVSSAATGEQHMSLVYVVSSFAKSCFVAAA